MNNDPYTQYVNGGFKVGDLETGSLEYFYHTTEHLEEDFIYEGAISWRADSTVMVENFCYVLTNDDLVEPRTSILPGTFDWLKD